MLLTEEYCILGSNTCSLTQLYRCLDATRCLSQCHNNPKSHILLCSPYPATSLPTLLLQINLCRY